MRTLAIFVLVIGGLVGGGALYYRSHAADQPANLYRVAEIQRGDLRATTTATGTIEPEEVVDVGAQVMGRIRDFGVDEEAAKRKVGIAVPADKPNENAGNGGNRPIKAAAPKTSASVSPPSKAPVGVGASESQPRIDYGSVVHVGTKLAYIDETRYRAQVEQAQAQLDRAMADLEHLEAMVIQASAALRRAEQLRQFEQTRSAASPTPLVAISESDYDLAVANDKVAKSNLSVGKAAVEQARAALKQAQTDLDYTEIVSPVEGVIIDRRVNIGQTVVAALNAPSLFLIAKDLSRLQVWASVNEADIGKIHPGMKVRFTVDAFPAETFEGRVKQIRLNAQMTQNVVVYTVVVETANPNGRLLPYLTANLEFEIEEHRGVLLVPNAALRWAPQPQQTVVAASPAPASAEPAGTGGAAGQDRGRVWTPEGNSVRPIDVELGPSDGLATMISGPEVNAGLKVVVGENTVQQTADDGTKNPFGPPRFPRARQSR